jgi:hypothetical protein
MLTLRDPLAGTRLPIAVAPGEVLAVAVVMPARSDPLTGMRVLITADLVCRVLEDIHSAQALLAVISEDRAVVQELLAGDLMVRPAAVVAATVPEAHADLGTALDLLVTAAGGDEQSCASLAVTMPVGPVTATTAWADVDPVTLRFAMLCTDYAVPLELSNAVVQRCEAALGRWRQRLDEWSRHPSHPITAEWRSGAVAAVDDDLDVARLTAMMVELEDAKGVEPGAKFEAFAFVDRVLAVDLTRELGRTRR